MACQVEDEPKLWSGKWFLYVAKMQKELILVKFTRRHCPRFHHFCAKRGHAPEFLGCGAVPRGGFTLSLVVQDHPPAHYAAMH